MSDGEDRVVGRAVAYRTGDASRNQATLSVRGSMHGQWTAARVKVPSEGTGIAGASSHRHEWKFPRRESKRTEGEGCKRND